MNKIPRSFLTGSTIFFVVISLTWAFSSPNNGPNFGRSRSQVSRTSKETRTLTFADRVAYQHAIEEVYWRHRIWPKALAGTKPSLNELMSQAQIEKKVKDYL